MFPFEHLLFFIFGSYCFGIIKTQREKYCIPTTLVTLQVCGLYDGRFHSLKQTKQQL